jgi:PAS domain S-box-containing protein
MNERYESGLRENLFLKGWPRVFVLLAGFIATALGLTVIIGWYAHLPILVQINPTFAPMQYNTALCILSLGVAHCVFAFGKLRTAQALGTFAAVLSGLTLFEYLLNINLGIDQLFFKAYITTETLSVGRMSPIAAICIFQTGLVFVLRGFRFQGRKWQPLAVALLASVVTSLCAIAILGYIFELPRTYGWGQLTLMALPTASGLEVLGFGIFVIAWVEGREKDGCAPRWLPVPVALGTIVASLVLWLALEAKQDFEIAKTIKANAENVQNQINAQMDSRIHGLRRMSERWEYSGRPARATWEEDAANYVRDFPDLQAIEWIDASHLVRWIVPLKGNEAKLNTNLLLEERRGRAAEMAQQQRQMVVTQPVELFHGGTGFVVYAPLYIGTNFDGVIGGVFNAQEMFDTFLPARIVTGNSIAISGSGVQIYQRNPSPLPAKQDWIVDSKIELNGTVWNVRTWPAPELLAQLDNSLPKIVLVVGLVMSFLLSLAIRLSQVQRNLNRQLAETLTLQNAILGSANYALISTTPEGVVTTFNASAERWLGYHAKEIVGKTTPAIWHDAGEVVARAKFLSDELRRTIEPGFESFVTKPRLGQVDEHEWTFIRKDGSRFPVSLSATALFDKAGVITGFLGVIADITERKQAEAKLAAQAAELKRSNQELREALGEVKTLSGLLPICGNCKKIRDDNGHWSQIETYVTHHTAASFSHGLCPACLVTILEDDGLEVSEKVREAAQKMG